MERVVGDDDDDDDDDNDDGNKSGYRGSLHCTRKLVFFPSRKCPYV